MIGAAPSAFADVITDWNEKAVAFVTPRMPPAAGQRVVAIMQVAATSVCTTNTASNVPV